jgi:phosphate transport system permease protein
VSSAAPVAPPPAPPEAPAERAIPRRTSKRRLLADKAARWIVAGGGLAIIASILGILIFIVHEVMPLLYPAHVTVAVPAPLPGALPLAVLTDEYRELAATLDHEGHIRVVRLADRSLVVDRLLPTGPGGPVAAVAPPGASSFVLGTADGRAIVQRVVFTTTYEGGKRRVGAELPPPDILEIDPEHRPVPRIAAQLSADGQSVTIAGATTGDTLVIDRETATTNSMTGAVERSSTRTRAALPAEIATLLLDGDQKNLFGGLRDGRLAWWRLDAAGNAVDLLTSSAEGAPIGAMTLLLGDRSLVVGRDDGSIDVWFPLQRGTGRVLRKVRNFPARPAPVVALAPSPRGKGVLALDARGGLTLLHSTSERVLWTGSSGIGGAACIAYAPKADGALIAGAGGVSSIAIENPHPEVSLTALFGKVWYEGYEGPEYAWQSSSGTEDFEPKLSLAPLLYGTLKGTIYSLILAVPLGVLSAMFASQFLHPAIRRAVKPTVEIMASLPSVVLGFLAGLWLAPIVERVLPSILVMLLVLPALIVAAGAFWERAVRRYGARLLPGSEVFFFVGVLAAGAWGCLAIEGWLEARVLGANFPVWLLQTFGVRYDQRNAVVVGLAMGFAVIPIIFAIAEDAFSNVPRSLVSGSLALGANRWQTVTRVVLPTASPGIFAAVMVGFGRAVGETMIVLMATGNTPITDWSPFNGFRTLSANIAVEIPEAPQGGTLYRTLFLAALLLFAVTFLVNTVAELVRQRLRRKYASL